jgi:hypothetical protein
MQEPEWICGLPFYTPSRKMEDLMTVGTLIEELIYMKKKYDIFYPDDNYINLACNVLEKMPQQLEVGQLLEKLKEVRL